MSVQGKVRVFVYGADSYSEVRDGIENIGKYLGRGMVWIDIDGEYTAEDLKRAAERLDFVRDLREMSAHAGDRPRFEDYSDHILAVLSQFYLEKNTVKKENVSVILGKSALITIQESGKEGDVLEGVRKAIRENKGDIRNKGVDYLFFMIVRAVMENYYPVLENMERKIDEIETRMTREPRPEVIRDIHRIRRELLEIRHLIWSMRGLTDHMCHDDSKVIGEEAKDDSRELYDSTLHLIDITDTYRDMVSSLTDIYLSSLSYRTNEIMKVLTIIATIFIPLTFITGIYGMNFRYMPELYWRFGYPMVLSLMLLIAVVMVIYFRKKGWM